jgi:hypothetical protein
MLNRAEQGHHSYIDDPKLREESIRRGTEALDCLLALTEPVWQG